LIEFPFNSLCWVHFLYIIGSSSPRRLSIPFVGFRFKIVRGRT